MPRRAGARAGARASARWTGLVVAGLALTACSATGVLDPAQELRIPVEAGTITSADSGGVGETGTTIIPVGERGDALEISGTTGDATSLTTADLRGRYVVVNAWASWCAPCIEEAPALAAAAARWGDRAAFVGLRVLDGDGPPHPALAALPYPSIVDADGAILATVPGVPPRALPSTTVLDDRGRVAARHIGPVTASILDAMLEQAGAGKAP